MASLRLRRPDRLPRDAAGGGAAGHDGRGRRLCSHLPRGRRAVRGARRRHRALGRRAAGRRGHRDLPAAAALASSRSTRRTSASRCSPASTNLARLGGGRAARLLLRARSVEPAGLHDRRQRGGELRRRALPQVRLHDHHVLAATFVTADGRVATLGHAVPDGPGLDLLGVVVGSEGTLGIVTEVVLRILPRPEAVETLLAAFDSTDAAGDAVSRIIAAGIVPAAIEMMDRLTIEAAEAAVHAGYPDCEAALLVELDGPAAEVRVARAASSTSCAARRARPRSAAPRRRARAPDVEGPQGRVRRDGPRLARLLRAGRRHPADAAARGAARHPRARGRVRPARRQRLPRRRRQPAPAGAVRRRRGGRVGARARGGRRASSSCASRRAARSPASTASATTRRARCRRCSPAPT